MQHDTISQRLLQRFHQKTPQGRVSDPMGCELHPKRNVCYKQFGNSVAVKVVRLIFEQAERALREKARLAA